MRTFACMDQSQPTGDVMDGYRVNGHKPIYAIVCSIYLFGNAFKHGSRCCFFFY